MLILYKFNWFFIAVHTDLRDPSGQRDAMVRKSVRASMLFKDHGVNQIYGCLLTIIIFTKRHSEKVSLRAFYMKAIECYRHFEKQFHTNFC